MPKKIKNSIEINYDPITIKTLTQSIFSIYKNNKTLSLKGIFSKIPELYILKHSKMSIKNKLITIKGYHSIKKNNLFDDEYYLRNNLDILKTGKDPLLYYLIYGFKENKNPNSDFDEKYYLKKYKDVKRSNLAPLAHYSLYGIKEKRKIHSSKRLEYIKFSDFLQESYNSPIITSEYFKEYKLCFKEMDNIANLLVEKVKNSKKLPLISVIMPVYNRVEIVKKAIDSVLNQTYKNIELIIIDDGSDDGTYELIQNMPDDRIVLIKNEINQGVSKSRNIALEKSKGEYIGYLDSDNDWDKNYISAMLGAFLELSDADAVYSGQLLFKKSKTPYAIRFSSFNKSLLRNRNYIDLNCFMHNKSIFEKFGNFDESLKRCVDWDMIERFSNQSKIYSIPILLSNYYENNDSNRISNKSSYNYCKKVRNDNIKQFKTSIENRSSDDITEEISVIIPNMNPIQALKKQLNVLFELQIDNPINIIVIEKNKRINNEKISFLKDLEREDKIKLILDENLNKEQEFKFFIDKNTLKDDYKSDILILTNDTYLTKKSTELMQKFSYGLPKCGLLIPQQIVPKNSKIIEKISPYALPTYEYDLSILSNPNNIVNMPIFHSGDILEIDSGFLSCFYMKIDIFNKIDSFEINLAKNNSFNKKFYTDIRKKTGSKIYYISDAVVYTEFK